jgi:hypothetical protein
MRHFHFAFGFGDILDLGKARFNLLKNSILNRVNTKVGEIREPDTN